MGEGLFFKISFDRYFPKCIKDVPQAVKNKEANKNKMGKNGVSKNNFFILTGSHLLFA